MKKKKILSVILSLALSMSLTMTTFAGELPESVSETDRQEVIVNQDESKGFETEENLFDGEEETDSAEPEKVETEAIEETQEETQEETEEETSTDESEVVSDKWTVSDFTYTTIEQTLNGCDYSREFQISGPAIAGFSESGEKKLEINKNLVLPSVNEEGEKLVGVAAGAFKDKGLESVKFPEGMMVDYDDTITNKVTKRGNFIIDTEAFAKNNLTSVTLPEGVIAVMSSAFKNNQLTRVSLPHTIWWIENSSFAYNNLTTVGFPKTCDFQLQIHAYAFAQNNIKSVRLPDYVEVVYKYAFVMNPGMEECPEEAPEKEKTLGGVVYMYTDNAALLDVERIHHIDRTAESQKSWHQKLIVGEKPADEGEWTIDDFTIEGTVITGLSESGIEKRKENKELILPDKNAEGDYITELADTTESYGLFTVEGEGFESVELPSHLQVIGDRAFVQNGLTSVNSFPDTLTEIGLAAFQNNKLTSVILPDSVTTLGGGAFATNPTLSKIVISKGLTEIASGAFGCSDATNYMENLTELVIPEGITKIGQNAFAGNNIKNIVIPSTVTEIGNYAFSTKNYLTDECTLTLNEGLTKIGSYAFRNKVIREVDLPSTVTALKANTFQKEYSDGSEALVTTVYVSKAQYKDTKNFPSSSYHTFVVKVDPDEIEWDEFDFTYATWEEAGVNTDEITMYPATDTEKTVTIASGGYVITGLSELGQAKLEKNKDMVIPAEGPNGQVVTGIAPKAFYKLEIESVTFPEGAKTTYDGPEDIIADGVTERGNFVICSNAFYGNNLKTLELPEGVIRVGTNAFAGNQLLSVSIPQTMWWINAGAFSKNQITTIDFPETCDFKLNVDSQAFASNQIKAVQLPVRTEKLNRYTFMINPGMEEVDESAPSSWKKGGVVYMYADPSVAEEAYVDHTENTGTHLSYAQKLITDEVMPETLKPWGTEDFTYSEDGAAITGLSEAGAAKRAVNPTMIMPDKGTDGTVITAIADGAGTNTYGTFGAENEPITTVVLPKYLESIGSFAFRNSGVESVIFPNTLKTIGISAFLMNSLTEVILPDSVTSVGGGAFATNPTIEKVKISAGMTEIPATFVGNTSTYAENFTEIEIPDGITLIGSNAFAGNSFTSVDIPASVTKIDSKAFMQTSAHRTLENITLHEGLEFIGSQAFSYVAATSLELPSTVTTLHKYAFRYSAVEGAKVKLYTSNKEQLVATSTFVTESDDHIVVYNNLVGTGWSYGDFIFDGAKVTGWSEQGNQTRLNNKKLVIPHVNPETGDEITAIGDGAFAIPYEEVTQLKDSVDSPNGMTSVDIPETVTEIGDKAFEYNSLTEVIFPENLTKIGVSAFHGNKLAKVTLPDSVTSVSEGAFAMNDITELTLPENLEKLEQGVFSMNIRLESITLPDTLTEIGDMAFAGARLTSLEIPKSVTKIGRKAFHLHHISELTIPGNVKEIGESAFEGTPKAITLKKLVLEEGIETIGSGAFKEGYLESVELPYSLKYLAADAFANNSGTDNDYVVVCYTENPAHAEFEESDTHRISLNGEWTAECFTYEDGTVTGLSRIGKALVGNNPDMIIPDKSVEDVSVTEIADGAFENCGIKSVILPESLTKIGARAFAENNLTTVKIPDKITSVAKDAFADNSTTVILEINDRTVLANLKNSGIEGVSLKDTSDPIKVTSIKVTGISKRVAAGKKITLKATVSPSNADNKGITWKSGNEKVATVNSKGVVTVKENTGGKTVKIYAIAKDGSGVKAVYTIRSMKGVVKKIAVTGAKTVKAGKSLKLKAKVTATKGANKKVVWTSSNTKYAKVTASGKVKTYKAGKGKTVKITAKTIDGSGKKKTVKIKIK
ncbi:MAG: leucine-rich repeat protein [Lachnospiraceae bacterium]